MNFTIPIVGDDLPDLLLNVPNTGPVTQEFINNWGGVMRMARRASTLATEDARKKKLITDPEESSILLYTDDPTTATWFSYTNSVGDLRAICKTSHIEGVTIMMGENFPPAAFEAERPDPEWPRVAAMFFRAPGTKCPRCRLWRNISPNPICDPCTLMIQPWKDAA